MQLHFERDKLCWHSFLALLLRQTCRAFLAQFSCFVFFLANFSRFAGTEIYLEIYYEINYEIQEQIIIYFETYSEIYSEIYTEIYSEIHYKIYSAMYAYSGF